MDRRKTILVFASDMQHQGCLGLQRLIEASSNNVLEAEICAVVSNQKNGLVRCLTERYKIAFWYMDQNDIGFFGYRQFVRMYNPDLIVLSNWVKPIYGLDSKNTINIHLGPLPRFGGRGMFGKNIHEAVIKAFRAGEVVNSAITIHFVLPFELNRDNDYSRKGPILFQISVPICPDDTAETLGIKVEKISCIWQTYVINLILKKEISWDGKDLDSLKVPTWYVMNLLPDKQKSCP